MPGGGVLLLLLNPFTGPESSLELLLCLHRTRVQFLVPTLSNTVSPIISVSASVTVHSQVHPHQAHTVFSNAQSLSQFSICLIGCFSSSFDRWGRFHELCSAVARPCLLSPKCLLSRFLQPGCKALLPAPIRTPF